MLTREHAVSTRAVGVPRIAVFIPSLRGGGAERAMLLFATGVAERGIDVDLVVGTGAGQLASEVPPSVNMIDLGVTRLSRALPALVRYLRRVRPHALYSTIMHANLIAIVARRLAMTDTRVVVRESNAPRSAVAASLGSRISLRLLPWIYPYADSIISVSGGVADELCELNAALGSKVTVLPTPVVYPAMLEASKEPLNADLAGRRYIVAAGRLHPQKDFTTLLRAFAQLRADLRPLLTLVILGEGSERSVLEELAKELGISDRLMMPGFVSNPFPYLRGAEVFVLSSRYEGMPNVLVQALALGTKVVATDCPSGPYEVLAGGKYGELVPVGDPVGLARAIERTIAQQPPDGALEYARKRFHIDSSVDDYLRASGLIRHDRSQQ